MPLDDIVADNGRVAGGELGRNAEPLLHRRHIIVVQERDLVAGIFGNLRPRFAATAARIAINSHGRLLCGGSGSTTSAPRSEEHTSELQSLMRISYAVFCLKKKK